MQFNKKYAIRKLAVGVASVAIGFTTVGINPQVVLASDVTSETFGRTNPGNVDTTGDMNRPKPTDEIKAVPNGEKNFYSTVAFTTEAGLGSGTLINEDTIVTVAHNFVHLNTKNNPITVENNVNKLGDIHIATLPNGKQVKFSNDDVKYWNREGYVQGFKNDLAVVKLKNKFTGETGATLHNEVAQLSNGDKIHVFGFPKGKLNPILNGTVENVENYGANIMGVAYQGSAPGMSGGGLYNANGELIGVNQNGVEGLRSGGITFSKEQLDWIKSIARGENAQPVYLQDEPQNNDKDKGKYDKLVEVDDQSGFGWIGELYEDGTYVIKGVSGKNVELNNTNGGVGSMFDGTQNKLKRIQKVVVEGNLVSNLFALSSVFNLDEIDLRGLKHIGEEVPLLTYNDSKLRKIQFDHDFSLASTKYGRMFDGAHNLKLTNEQVTQLLKNTSFDSSNLLFNDVGVERLDLSTMDNSKWTGKKNYTMFKDLIGLKEVVFGDKFNFNNYNRKGTKEAFLDTDLSKVERVTFVGNKMGNDKFVKDWLTEVQKLNDTNKSGLYRDGKYMSAVSDTLNDSNMIYEDGVYTLGVVPTQKPEDKVVVEEIEPTIKYVGDTNKEYGSKEERIVGNKGSKTTTITYELDKVSNSYKEKELSSVVVNPTETIVTVGTKPKVERFEKDNKLIEKTTTYIVNEHNGEITENSTERVIKDNNKNDETVNLHYYIDYYIPSSIEEWRNGLNIPSKLIKSIDYNRPTKWIKGEDLTNGLYDGVEKTIEYNGIKYKQVGLESTRRITNETTNNTDTKEYYDNYNSNWRVGTEPVFKPTVAEEGGVYRLPVFFEPQVGWITQKFYSEAYKQQTNPNINAEERYKLKDDVVLPPHSIDDKVEVPNTPQYIQKANRIYKLVSNDPVPNHYEVANNSISYFYKNLNLQATEKTVETQSLVKYKADDSKERNSENIRIEGKPKITQIIINPKVIDDGTLSEETFEEVIQNSVDTIIKVGTKPKVEYSTKGKNVIKTTTSYSVNENTGEVTETTTSEIVDTLEGLMPPILSKDEYKGEDSTNTPVDKDDNLILPPIVDIPEYKDDIVNEPQKVTKEKLQPKESNKQESTENTQKSDKQQDVKQDTVNTTESDNSNVVQKQALPKTNALHSTAYVLGLLLSTVGLKQNKKD